jgi:hypothetical protein
MRTRARDVRDSGHKDPLVESVGQQEPIGVHLEVPSACEHERRVRRIRRHVSGAEAPNGREDPRRAAARVLVQVEAQASARIWIALNTHTTQSQKSKVKSQRSKFKG